MLELSGVGDLRANHLIGLGAIIGFVPIHMFDMCDGGADKAYEAVKTVYGRNVPSKDATMDNIHHLMEKTMGRNLSRRYSENAFCKIGRVIVDSDKLYRDILDTRFPIIRVENSTVKVISKKETEDVFTSLFEIKTNAVTPKIKKTPKKGKARPWMEAIQC